MNGSITDLVWTPDGHCLLASSSSGIVASFRVIVQPIWLQQHLTAHRDFIWHKVRKRICFDTAICFMQSAAGLYWNYVGHMISRADGI